MAWRYIGDFPLTRAGLIEWYCLRLDAYLLLESLFDPVDIGDPFNGMAPREEQ